MFDWINSKPLDQIEWADIESLIGKVSESSQIEFKSDLSDGEGKPISWEKSRDKILRELSAFANSYGGTTTISGRSR